MFFFSSSLICKNKQVSITGGVKSQVEKQEKEIDRESEREGKATSDIEDFIK